MISELVASKLSLYDPGAVEKAKSWLAVFQNKALPGTPSASQSNDSPQNLSPLVPTSINFLLPNSPCASPTSSPRASPAAAAFSFPRASPAASAALSAPLYTVTVTPDNGIFFGPPGEVRSGSGVFVERRRSDCVISTVYVGNFKEDKLDGLGTLVWLDGTGTVYCGTFKNGLMHGVGSYFDGDNGKKSVFVDNNDRSDADSTDMTEEEIFAIKNERNLALLQLDLVLALHTSDPDRLAAALAAAEKEGMPDCLLLTIAKDKFAQVKRLPHQDSPLDAYQATGAPTPLVRLASQDATKAVSKSETKVEKYKTKRPVASLLLFFVSRPPLAFLVFHARSSPASLLRQSGGGAIGGRWKRGGGARRGHDRVASKEPE
jgi:hypothetical protein